MPQLDELLARVDQCSTQAHELSAHFEDLREQIRQAIDIAQRDPEMSLIRARKVLEYIVVDIYDEALKPKRAGSQPLEGLVHTLVKEGQFPNRLAAYADMVRGLGNVGAHGRDKGVDSHDVLNSLSNLLPIVEWFFEQRKFPSQLGAAAPAQRRESAGDGPRSTAETAAAERVAAIPQSAVVAGSASRSQIAAAGAKPKIASAEDRARRIRLAAVAALAGIIVVGIALYRIWAGNREHGQPSSANALRTDASVAATVPLDHQVPLGVRSGASQPPPPAKSAAANLPTTTNSIGMKLTLIPAGEFMMGSQENEPGVEPGERPLHRVHIAKPFYLGTYSVKRAQFSKFVDATHYKTDAERDGKGSWGVAKGNGPPVMARKPEFSWRNTGFPQSDEHPVVDVSWNDAMAFCRWLRDREGATYRLPTEAQWEYACRAGTTSAYFFGDDPQDLPRFARMGSRGLTMPVGSFESNPFGLYDMLGNAWQWCADWYDADYYAASTPVDPSGPAAGSQRAIRGGSWNSIAAFCRCGFRNQREPAASYSYLGFRVVREP